MKLAEPTLLDVLYVVHHMREWDRREIFACRFDDDPDRFAMDLFRAAGPYCWVAGLSGQAIAVIGATELFPGTWSALMFGTDDLRKIGFPLTRFARQRMIPAIRAQGARFGECRSIEGHTDAHNWLKVLGARQKEEPLRGYGKGGENFYHFVWEF